MFSVFSLRNLGYFLSELKLSPENVDKAVFIACVFHNYFRNDVSVGDCVIENTDAPSQFSYVTTFRRSSRSASEEAMSVREKYPQYFERYFENVGSDPWQPEAIRKGRAFQK
jgi:hypothetical protein